MSWKIECTLLTEAKVRLAISAQIGEAKVMTIGIYDSEADFKKGSLMLKRNIRDHKNYGWKLWYITRWDYRVHGERIKSSFWINNKVFMLLKYDENYTLNNLNVFIYLFFFRRKY